MPSRLMQSQIPAAHQQHVTTGPPSPPPPTLTHPHPPPAAACGEVRDNYDYGVKGSHFTTGTGTGSAADCCAACRANSQCKYFVRRKSDGECYLKADQGTGERAGAWQPLSGFEAGGPVQPLPAQPEDGESRTCNPYMRSSLSLATAYIQDPTCIH